MDFSVFLTVDAWLSLAMLTLLEVILGIDNIVFISILSGKLPKHQQAKARRLGLAVALIARVVLLLGISWVMGLKVDLFSIGSLGISGKDLILILGGIFLVGKATHEIYENVDGVLESLAAFVDELKDEG